MIGTAIREARKAQNLTVLALAIKAQQQPSHVQRLETNNHDPKLSTVIRLAHALKMSLGELANDVEPADDKEVGV